jgi:hypothetical protein
MSHQRVAAKAKALFLSNDVFFMVNDTQVEIMRPYAPCDDVTSCVNVVRTVHHHHIIIIIGISLMQGIYTCIPETNHVPREQCVATILM